MPSMEGAEVRRNLARNCWPCMRSFCHSPEAVTHSPAEIEAAWPMTVTRSRWPRALMRRTQKPFSEFVEGHALDEAGECLGLRGRSAHDVATSASDLDTVSPSRLRGRRSVAAVAS
jgi:hypothetical protein